MNTMKEEIEIVESLIARRAALLKSLEDIEKLGSAMSLKEDAAMIGLRFQIRQDKHNLECIKMRATEQARSY